MPSLKFEEMKKSALYYFNIVLSFSHEEKCLNIGGTKAYPSTNVWL